jgi:hypothetical protein
MLAASSPKSPYVCIHTIVKIIDKVLSELWAVAKELGCKVSPLKRQDCMVRFGVPRNNVESLAYPRCAAAKSTGQNEHVVSCTLRNIVTRTQAFVHLAMAS